MRHAHSCGGEKVRALHQRGVGQISNANLDGREGFAGTRRLGCSIGSGYTRCQDGIPRCWTPAEADPREKPHGSQARPALQKESPRAQTRVSVPQAKGARFGRRPLQRISLRRHLAGKTASLGKVRLVLRRGLLQVGFQVGAQARQDLFFMPFLQLFLYFFEGEVDHIMVVEFQRGDGLAESQP